MIVYKLTSPSGKCYIGMTKSTLENRWKQHLTLWRKLKRNGVTDYRGNRGCPLLFFAFDKYDPETWTKEVVFTAKTLKECQEKEIELIAQYETMTNGYNVLTGGNAGLAGLTLTEEHKSRQSEAALRFWQSEEGQKKKQIQAERLKGNTFGSGERSEETKQKISERLKGRPLSEEQKLQRKISANAYWKTPEGELAKQKLSNDRKGTVLSPEHIQSIRESRLGKTQTDHQKKRATEANSKEWIVTYPDGSEETITNLRQWSIAHGVSQGNLITYGKSKGYKARKA